MNILEEHLVHWNKGWAQSIIDYNLSEGNSTVSAVLLPCLTYTGFAVLLGIAASAMTTYYG